MLTAKLIGSETPLHATIQREVITVGGSGSIDESEFNREYVRQMDLVANVLEGDGFVDYTEDEILAMENKLLNITRGGVLNG